MARAPHQRAYVEMSVLQFVDCDFAGILVEAYLVECDLVAQQQDEGQQPVHNPCTTKVQSSALGLKRHSGVLKLRAPASVAKPRTGTVQSCMLVVPPGITVVSAEHHFYRIDEKVQIQSPRSVVPLWHTRSVAGTLSLDIKAALQHALSRC
jgi:hypothetical protein